MNNDAQLTKLTIVTFLEVEARALVRSRENLVRAAAKSPGSRQIIREMGGIEISDEEIAYVQERDARRNAGDWSILDELKAE